MTEKNILKEIVNWCSSSRKITFLNCGGVETLSRILLLDLVWSADPILILHLKNNPLKIRPFCFGFFRRFKSDKCWWKNFLSLFKFDAGVLLFFQFFFFFFSFFSFFCHLCFGGCFTSNWQLMIPVRNWAEEEEDDDQHKAESRKQLLNC